MAEDLLIGQGTKQEQYESLVPQIGALITGETDLIANLANITAALKEQFGWFWVGFYWVKDNELVVGPFQGPVACSRIAKGKGVCGQAWERAETIIVPDVNQFSGHIACNSKSQSEIVLPIFKDGEVVGVLDVDEDVLNAFDEVDEHYLKQILDLLTNSW